GRRGGGGCCPGGEHSPPRGAAASPGRRRQRHQSRRRCDRSTPTAGHYRRRSERGRCAAAAAGHWLPCALHFKKRSPRNTRNKDRKRDKRRTKRERLGDCEVVRHTLSFSSYPLSFVLLPLCLFFRVFRVFRGGPLSRVHAVEAVLLQAVPEDRHAVEHLAATLEELCPVKDRIEVRLFQFLHDVTGVLPLDAVVPGEKRQPQVRNPRLLDLQQPVLD